MERFIEDSQLPPQAPAAARNELAQLTAVLPPFTFLRNKSLSHADLAVSLKLEIPPVQLNDVDFAIERLKAIVRISEAHHGLELTTEGGGSLFDEDEFRGELNGCLRDDEERECRLDPAAGPGDYGMGTISADQTASHPA